MTAERPQSAGWCYPSDRDRSALRDTHYFKTFCVRHCGSVAGCPLTMVLAPQRALELECEGDDRNRAHHPHCESPWV